MFITAKVFQNRSGKLGNSDITFTDNTNTKTKIEIIIFKGVNTIFFNMGFRLSSSLSHDKIFIFSSSSNTNSQIGIRFIIIFYNIVSLNYVCYNNSIVSDFSNTSGISICPFCKIFHIRLYHIIVSQLLFTRTIPSNYTFFKPIRLFRFRWCRCTRYIPFSQYYSTYVGILTYTYVFTFK